MSDDLIKRLRDWSKHDEDLCYEAAEYIKQLERENARLDAGWSDANRRALDAGLKLAKAVEALRKIAASEVEFWDEDSGENVMQWLNDEEMADIARAVLAELEGGE